MTSFSKNIHILSCLFLIFFQACTKRNLFNMHIQIASNYISLAKKSISLVKFYIFHTSVSYVSNKKSLLHLCTHSRKCKDHWVAGLSMKEFSSLEQLRTSLFAYLETYQTCVHSSLNGFSSKDRFFKEACLIKRLS